MSVDIYAAREGVIERPWDGGRFTAFVQVDTGHEINRSNVNAAAVLGFLGIDPGRDLCGHLPLPEARRAVIRGRNACATRLATHARPYRVGVGARGARWVEGGIDTEYLVDATEAFARLVEAAEAAGATHIAWS